MNVVRFSYSYAGFSPTKHCSFFFYPFRTWKITRSKLPGQIISSLHPLTQLIFFYDMWWQKCCFFFIKRKTKHKPPHSKPHPRRFHRFSLSVLSQNAFDKYLSFVRNDILYHDLFFNHMFFYEYRKVTNTNNNMLKIKLQTMKTHIINLLSFLNTKYLV